MFRFFTALIGLVFFTTFAYAVVSSSEAVAFVQNGNHFLTGDESAELFPDAKISFNKANYWVVSIVVDSSLNGLIALSDSKPIALAKGDITLGKLFETAYALRSIDSLKRKISGQWVFSGSIKQDLARLSQLMGSESSDLEIVKTDLKDFPELQSQVDELNQQAVALRIELESTSNLVGGVNNSEQGFFDTPSVEELPALKGKYFDSLDLFIDLDSKRIEYNSAVTKLTQGINRTSLAPEVKLVLDDLASPSSELSKIGNWSSSAGNVEQKLSELFDSLPSKTSGFVENFKIRIKRNNAFNSMNGADNEIIELTKNSGQFSSVNDLQSYISGKDVVELWQKQEDVAKLRENWRNAQTAFSSAKYDLATDSAKKAKANALNVYKAGFIAAPSEQVNNELLVNAAIALIALLIVLVVARKRKKLFSFFVKNSEEEQRSSEVDFSPWNKPPKS